MAEINTHILRKPGWLKTNLPAGDNYQQIKKIIRGKKLNTICSSGMCPNIGECWGLGTATFMILGNICTRSCKFCATNSGKPESLNMEEPLKIAQAVYNLKLKHCVITSVTRDDLTDGGASVWAKTIETIKKLNPEITIEALIPDFKGDKNAIQQVADEQPDIISHNLETVESLTPHIRNKASYYLSLEVLKYLLSFGAKTKSGIMVGLGETEDEVYKTMEDLLKVGCNILTIGQYLQPTKNHWPVKEYIHPDIFKKYKETALKKGFKFVESGPLVKSSYHAERNIM